MCVCVFVISTHNKNISAVSPSSSKDLADESVFCISKLFTFIIITSEEREMPEADESKRKADEVSS